MGAFRGFPGQLISRLTPNSTTTSSITIAGRIDSDGDCDGVEYSEDGETWSDAVVQATIKIKLTDYLATVKLELEQVSLKGGITCTYSEGRCMDPEVGETFWTIHPDQNCENYAEIFYGTGRFVTERVNKDTTNQYVVINQDKKVFALKLLSKDVLCNEKMWISEHPQLYVIEVKATEFHRWPNTPIEKDVDLTTYVNTKFLYVEATIKSSLADYQAFTLHRRCLLHREVLRNRLAMAPFAPNVVSTLIKQSLGYLGKIAGEVLYILKCVPKVVQLRRETACFAEIPVSVGNESYFMAPVTRVLQKHAEPIHCSSIIPPMYFLQDQWLTLNPLPAAIANPTQLAPELEPDFKFKTLSNIASGGLYTQQEIRQAQDAVLFGLERNAINTIIAKKISAHATTQGDYSTLHLFSTEELHQLAEKTSQHLWGWFHVIGKWTSGFLGLYMIIRLLKFAVEVILNALALHNIHGWSLKLFASLWDTLTFLLLHRHHQMGKGAPKSQQKDDVLDPTAPPADEQVHDMEITVNNDGTNRQVKLYPPLNPFLDPRPNDTDRMTPPKVWGV